MAVGDGAQVLLQTLDYRLNFFSDLIGSTLYQKITSYGTFIQKHRRKEILNEHPRKIGELGIVCTFKIAKRTDHMRIPEELAPKI